MRCTDFMNGMRDKQQHSIYHSPQNSRQIRLYSIMNRIVGSRTTLTNLIVNINKASSRNMSGEWGSGSGKGGGSGGSVRDAGGAFGRMEAAREEEFFRRKQQQELEKLRAALDTQRSELEKQIKDHEAEIERLRKIQKEDK
ncbi:hypothetical protein BLA29_001976 [Euroglyphus maynei]|uniref:ATP synthase F1 subunit epsilon n=1 Tax=Euroglyphus maynei TaxID=6958 RepID=A0A1Y3BN14_EURMA|nr:hypothetical protein BLA29_001976 [Euroglyphus maynei]